MRALPPSSAVFALACLTSSCASSSPTSSPTSSQAPADSDAKGTWTPRAPFLDVKRAHPTALTKDGPITPNWPALDEVPTGATRVTFSSGGRELWAWFGAPLESTTTPAPALVYFHGHFFMKPKDYAMVRSLQAHGFAVMTATLRGRNGNGGGHEMLFGEVDDAAAAVRFLAARDDVDATRIYSFGHSMGGGASAMLSLMPDVPVRLTGGCGAVYSTETFRNWAKGADSDLIRFDADNATEVELRVLLPWADQLSHPHIALMGDRETTTLRNAKAVQARAASAGQSFAGKSFAIVVVPGGHSQAITPAFATFSKFIIADAAATGAPDFSSLTTLTAE